MHVEFLLKHTVDDLIPNWYDEAILLFDEPTVDLTEISIALIAHVGPGGIGQPLVHGKFMVKVHDLGQ